MITAFDGQDITRQSSLLDLLFGREPGDEVTVTVDRDGDAADLPGNARRAPRDDRLALFQLQATPPAGRRSHPFPLQGGQPEWAALLHVLVWDLIASESRDRYASAISAFRQRSTNRR